jgi:hypothetical protein
MIISASEAVVAYFNELYPVIWPEGLGNNKKALVEKINALTNIRTSYVTNKTPTR